ncbi:hypothetical protein FEM48_Zijuj11G0008400 [Ziziphus jujuba var. spinosa]|uniref:Micro-fibrillar-associated protein 1 C-terminal domain-containing protein n=1 Tax=Ziziphus jujuba var. spinosa TaxID=714518 RepID=A0A978UFW4_ZIZJJ|nr:hypothetical protein FEM48_Zijuj11G0008400 [Ziziphus jujuba var. spinosa]
MSALEDRIHKADHRLICHAEIVSAIEKEAKRKKSLHAEEEEEEEEDADALDERRRRIKEKFRQREQEEAPLLPSEDDEEEESQYETDSEEELTGLAMVKIVFVPKSERDTVAERERIEAEEWIVVEEIRKDEEIQKKSLEWDTNIADIDTDNETNEAEEYQAWKAREIARIKSEREVREARLEEKKEIEWVRNMAEEERREWERKNPRPKRKWRFMQRYYHKGAFFQSYPDDPSAATAVSDDIFNRDFSAPTAEDKMNNTNLPKVLHVKHFGRSGRTKWTRHINEDITYCNNF